MKIFKEKINSTWYKNWLWYLVPILLLVPGTVFAEYAEGMEHYWKAWAAYSRQQFEEARRWVRKAVGADPQNGHAVALQGDLYYLQHDLVLAKEAWQRAMSLNSQLVSLSDQIQQVEVELQLEAGLKPAALGSLVVRVPEGLSQKQTEEIVQTLSQAREGIAPYFQYRVDRPLTVLIYPREVFYASSHMPTEVLGLFDGKIRVPAEPVHPEQTVHPSTGLRVNGASKDGSPATNNQQLVTVLWHEYTHAVVYDASHSRAPRWLQEGLAQEAETIALRQAQGDRPLESVGAARPGDSSEGWAGEPVETQTLPPLRSLLGIAQRPGEPMVMPAGQFYSASESLVRYLLETWGWDRMRGFLKGLGAGQSVEEAIQAVYGWDLKTLERKWRSSQGL